jgi:hypothetical protein
MDFYYLHPLDVDTRGVACVPAGVAFDSLAAMIGKDGQLPFSFALKEGGFDDYLANDLGLPLFSGRLRDAIEKQTTVADAVSWVAVAVVRGEERLQYFVPRFPPSSEEVLDLKRTIRTKSGFIVKACLKKSAVKGRVIFPIPGSESRIVICDLLKKALEAGHFSGVDFGHVAVA